jgi:hypothetical protein
MDNRSNGELPNTALCDLLSAGNTQYWREAANRANSGELRTYDALRALENGLKSQLRTPHVSGNEDIDRNGFGEQRRMSALETLGQIADYHADLVKYDGIELYKK